MTTSPTENTFVSGTHCGAAKRSTSQGTFGSAAATLLCLTAKSRPAASMASGVAGIRPPFERMATRFRAMPSATTYAPRILRLRRAATSRQP
jgi:hypothetical protein